MKLMLVRKLNRTAEFAGLVISLALVVLVGFCTFWLLPDWIIHQAVGGMWRLGVRVEPTVLIHVLWISVWFVTVGSFCLVLVSMFDEENENHELTTR